MFAQHKNFFGVLTMSLALLWSSASMAASSGSAAPAATATASSTSTSTSFKERYLKNVSASHSLELWNSSTKAPSGNLDGKGNNLMVAHYTQVAYKLPNNFGISLTNLIFQTFNRDRNDDKLNFSDPYFTFSNSKIINNGDKGFNLYGYLRYYVPISGATKAATLAGSPKDTGNGRFRLLLAPSQTLFGGKMEASLSTSIYYRLAQNSTHDRVLKTGSGLQNDYYVYYAPNLAWNVNDKTQLYVEYFSGYISHYNNGKMPRDRKNAATGEYIGLGANLTPSKMVTVTPSLAWGPKFLLDNASIGLFTTIKLL